MKPVGNECLQDLSLVFPGHVVQEALLEQWTGQAEDQWCKYKSVRNQAKD